MPVRPTQWLKNQQQRMLEEHSEQLTTAVEDDAQANSEELADAYRLGRVTQVVSSHVTLGPHLLVVPQMLAGTPPAASDLSVPAQPVYPTPDNSVNDYSVDDYVSVWTVDGVSVAARLA